MCLSSTMNVVCLARACHIKTLTYSQIAGSTFHIKNEVYTGLLFFLFCLKIKIMGTRGQVCTHNPCFEEA